MKKILSLLQGLICRFLACVGGKTKRNMEEMNKEGEEIARMLGNGVRYAGPQLDTDGSLVFHVFNDDMVTNTSFVANNIKEAREGLVEIRKLFKASVPIFNAPGT